jgi:hypothetical protein
LEAAGVKEPRDNQKAEKRKQKRIEMKRARNAQRKQIKKSDVAEKKGQEEI